MRDRTILKEVVDVFTSPEQYSMTLSSQRVDLGAEGVSLYRNNDRVEFLVPHESNQQLLITLPTTVERLEQCRVVEQLLRRIGSDMMTSYEVVRAKVTPVNQPHNTILADVAVQILPHGVRLSEWQGADPEHIYCALDLLEESLHARGLHFTSIDAESLIVGEDGRLRPTRYANLRFGALPTDVTSEFDAVREWFQRSYEVMPRGDMAKMEGYLRRHDALSERYLYASEPHEERVMVEDLSGWGFVDSAGEVVVEPKYECVTPFAEGRAMVQSERGWGLIDIDGHEVIAAEYESIGYNVATGISSLRRGDKWGYFSYMGEQLTPFTLDYPNEEISHAELRAMIASTK